MFKKTTFNIDTIYLSDLSNSLQFGSIPIAVLYNIFKDGRLSGLLIEHLIESMFLNLTRLKQENSSLDFIDSKGGRYEVRVITKNGVKFIPSHMIGKGRKFNQEGFDEKLAQIDYFLLCDVNNFPKISIFTIKNNHSIVLKKEIKYDKILPILDDLLKEKTIINIKYD